MAPDLMKTLPPGTFFRAHAGFPSPGEDWIEQELDVASLLVPHPTSTYFAQVSGHSMQGAGIGDGDLLVIDKALDPKPGSIIIAVLDGQYVVRQFDMRHETILLLAAHPAYPPIPITSETRFAVWGVVTFVLKPLAPTGPLAAQLSQRS